MEKLVEHYIQEAKEGIEIDGEIISLLSKKESDTILKKNGITNQVFTQLSKSTMKCYDDNFAGQKAGDFINNTEIKAKFPDGSYIQDITVRSYLCHVIEKDKETFDNAIKNMDSAIYDITLNMAVVQLKKIYNEYINVKLKSIIIFCK